MALQDIITGGEPISEAPQISNKGEEFSRVDACDRVFRRVFDRHMAGALETVTEGSMIIAATVYTKCRYAREDRVASLLEMDAEKNKRVRYDRRTGFAKWMLDLQLIETGIGADTRYQFRPHSQPILATVEVLLQNEDEETRFRPKNELPKDPSEKETIEFIDGVYDHIRRLGFRVFLSKYNTLKRNAHRRNEQLIQKALAQEQQEAEEKQRRVDQDEADRLFGGDLDKLKEHRRQETERRELERQRNRASRFSRALLSKATAIHDMTSPEDGRLFMKVNGSHVAAPLEASTVYVTDENLRVYKVSSEHIRNMAAVIQS